MAVWFALRTCGRLSWVAIVCLLVVAQTALAQPVDVCAIETSERIVAVADVHGAYDRFVAILRAADLIDDRANWVGGRAVLVQTGDVLDRGPESRRALDLLRRLEEQASGVGGQVHALLGNHEVMRVVGDLRYVSEGEYAEFKTAGSEELRNRYYDLLARQTKERAEADGQSFDEDAFREGFLAQAPLGFVEMMLAFRPDGEYGSWLRRHNTVAKINGIVFVHGGIHASVAQLGCEEINSTVRNELETMPWVEDPEQTQTALAVGPDGPLWYRGLALDDEAGLAPIVDGLLDALDARAIVMGHTVTDSRKVTSRLDGRLLLLDTGMLDGDYYPGGRAVALEVREKTLSAIYEDGREELSGVLTAPPVAAIH